MSFLTAIGALCVSCAAGVALALALEMAWEAAVRRRQRRAEDEQQRAYRAGRG